MMGTVNVARMGVREDFNVLSQKSGVVCERRSWSHEQAVVRILLHANPAAGQQVLKSKMTRLTVPLTTFC